MRILMLGWEFPPFITGGLGTACYGLTRALNRRHVQITFILPRPIETDYTAHVRLLAPERRPAATTHDAAAAEAPASPASSDAPASAGHPSVPEARALADERGADPARSPYPDGPAPAERGISFIHPPPPKYAPGPMPQPPQAPGSRAANPTSLTQDPDIPQAVAEYRQLCLALAEHETFDLIHAHDWVTFPAAEALAKRHSKPFIAHIHSTEHDRAGDQPNPTICDIEQQGLSAAARVVAVSSFTRSRISQHYGIEPQRIRVIYNGLDAPDPPAWSRQGPVARPAKASGQRHVLFLGRVTAQKGPDFFLDAAKKVLSQQKNVKFIIAGTGDRIEPIIDRAAREGIGRHVLFTGFLRGSEVQRVYQMADLFVMPSVSEPFGLATLEAVSHEVPVIVSRQAGVAEVLDSALKVDFWDTDEVAEKILAVLSRPALSQTLRDQAGQELRRLTWDHAAGQTTELYHQITAGA